MATPTTLAPGDAPKLVKRPSTNDVKSAGAITQTVFGCQHVKSLLTQMRPQAMEGYNKVLTALAKNSLVDRFYKSEGVVTTTFRETYLCMQCPTISRVRERHHPKHGFFVDSSTGFLYCIECKDFIYDTTFEELRSASLNNSSKTANPKKRKYSALMSESDSKLITAHTAPTPCAATGLRGLYNMGQTCFMSVILQSLIHNPFLRAYYMAEGHRSTDCEREACTACALDDIFTDFLGYEKHEGYGAVHMLQGCWKGGGSLAGYSQQDAHEFLGFILNSLHEAITEEWEDEKKSSSGRNGGKDCPCVIHQTFFGLLRSSVTCLTCQKTNTTFDPFLDLSLEVKSATGAGTGAAATTKKKKLLNGTQTVREPAALDLADCLDRFTAAETLPAEYGYHCRNCDRAREARKRLALHRLPPVLPIHLKRFAHEKKKGESAKVDTRVRFPLELDLTPYAATTKAGAAAAAAQAEQLAAAKSEDAAAKDEDKDEDDDTISVSTPTKSGQAKDPPAATPGANEARYTLSSVVVHKGKIDNGHYISYAKQDDEWFRFDDSMVVQVAEKEVLSAEAYMLFYVVAEI